MFNENCINPDISPVSLYNYLISTSSIYNTICVYIMNSLNINTMVLTKQPSISCLCYVNFDATVRKRYRSEHFVIEDYIEDRTFSCHNFHKW